jgi:hypothetical protein
MNDCWEDIWADNGPPPQHADAFKIIRDKTIAAAALEKDFVFERVHVTAAQSKLKLNKS